VTADLIEELNQSLTPAYRIERQLGAGGMATVWLAHDVRHRRVVAIKVLHREISAILGTERFLKEIEVTAGLQHPHILPLFDSGSAGWILYYVMPYVDGESLRQRLVRDGALPIREAVRILRDVADALAHAHAHGVVHRDIKPENVMLRDRHALIADFGIAKALTEAAEVDTITVGGVAIGTPAYMSPEQAAADKRVDHRADIYAFGILAYEVLTGRVPFEAATTRALLVAHLTSEPPPLLVQRPEIPPRLAALVDRCLEKDPDVRWQRADDIVAELEELDTSDAGVAQAKHPRTRAVIAIAAVVLGILIVAGLWWRRTPESSSYRVGRVMALTTSEGLELDPTLSPNGKTVAYVVGPPGRTRVYLRQIDGGRAIPLIDDSVAPNQRWPQWSPDGARIVFQAGADEALYRADRLRPGGTIYSVPALGGTPRQLVAPSMEADAFAPCWSPDGRQLAFVRSDTVYLIPSDGGTPQFLAATRGAFGPRWSPDGTRIAYAAGNPRFVFGTTHLGNDAPASIWVVRVADKRATLVVPDSSLNVSPVWTPDSRSILFVSDRGGRRDVYRLPVQSSGERGGVTERVTTGIDAHTIDLSRDGTRLVYSAYTPSAHLWSLPMPHGTPARAYDGKQLTFDREAIEGIALSADGRWLAFDSDRSGNFDVWKMPAQGGAPAQLTTDPTGDHVQSWSPNGEELVLHSFRTGNRDVFVMGADGNGLQRVTFSPVSDANPVWCDNNSLIIQSSTTGNEEFYLWTRQKRGAPWVMAKRLTTEHAADPACSPDGQWVSYVWDGALNVISMTSSARRVLVPASDPAKRPEPAMPAFGPDSRTVYYMAYDDLRRGSIWSVPLAGGDPTLLVRFDDPARPSLRRDFATDGKTLYFAIAQPQSDIYLMELSSR
jgi:serine/threonine protein kinase/Tol biopolymer transport system component